VVLVLCLGCRNSWPPRKFGGFLYFQCLPGHFPCSRCTIHTCMLLNQFRRFVDFLVNCVLL
jgi:hypothetical protein